jgi:tripartite-type tricarboxylate transporter receptor subunit TctC
MLGGRIHLNIGTAATLLPLIQQGKVRAISVWGPQRYPQLPEVPTMIESGFPGISLGFWVGMAAPKATPAPVIAKLNAAVNEVLADTETKARMEKRGLETRAGTPQDFAAFLAEERPKWAAIVKASGVKVQ